MTRIRRIADLSPAELESLRNEVEISIFHARDRLNDLTLWIFLLTALNAFNALFIKDPTALVLPGLVALLTSDVRARASVGAAIGFCALGIASVFDYPRLWIPGHKAEPPDFGWRLTLFFGGALLLGAALHLRNLIRFRMAIPLPTADHLYEGNRTFRVGVE